MSTMSEATTRRMEEAVDRVLELLIDELGIEPFAMTLEPGDSFTAVDVLSEAMVLAVIAGTFVKLNLPPPPLTEINEICAKVFMQKATH
jgi:hypothetical protein